MKKVKINRFKNMDLSEFWAVPAFKIDLFSKKAFYTKSAQQKLEL